jgi:DNA repair protein RecN (Recombination protein N)
MLSRLYIRNYAIIKEVDIHFDSKLNIITGETGAGKSILMGALGLILGERADTKVLMTENEKCVVEGYFQITSYLLQDYFNREGLDYEDTCIIRREISAAGKSRAFINDTPVSLQQLKELGAQLVDIVSQHQTLELNEASFQLNLVDAVAETEKEIVAYRQTYKTYKQTEKLLHQLLEKETKARQDEDYFRFMLKELADANLQADEQAVLEKEIDSLSHAEIIQQSAGNAYHALDGAENNLLDEIRNIKQLLAQGAKFDDRLKELINRLDAAAIELKDIAAEAEQIAGLVLANPHALAEAENRLQLLINLQKKHRVQTNAELIAYQQQLQQDIDALGSLEKQIDETRSDLGKLEAALSIQAQTLSSKRVKSLPAIEKQIHELLKQVQMPEARIKIEHAVSDSYGSSGKDEIAFMFAANKGGKMQNLIQVASGGELSRLMLCIKSLISDKVALPTIVFDEIDTGISGEAALKVSQVMKKHAGKHQVLAITHLPQIAGKANAHFYVYKSSDRNSTSTFIKKLNEKERVEEIARMLHGENPSEKVIEAAKELIN